MIWQGEDEAVLGGETGSVGGDRGQPTWTQEGEADKKLSKLAKLPGTELKARQTVSSWGIGFLRQSHSSTFLPNLS